MRKRPIIIVTGCSGSGKSTTLAAFEDAGFYCIDNMPTQLVDHFLEVLESPDAAEEIAGWVFGMDLRDKGFLSGYPTLLANLKSNGYTTKILFLEADDQALLRRYNQTRRHHPLRRCGSLLDAIQAEKSQIQPLRQASNHIIDTTYLSVHELKFAVLNIARQHTAITGMAINVGLLRIQTRQPIVGSGSGHGCALSAQPLFCNRTQGPRRRVQRNSRFCLESSGNRFIFGHLFKITGPNRSTV